VAGVKGDLLLLTAADKHASVFGDVKPFFDFSFHKTAEIMIPVQQILVLVSVAGKDIFDQDLCLIQQDLVLVAEDFHGRKYL
jgi:hypothetical protein